MKEYKDGIINLKYFRVKATLGGVFIDVLNVRH